MAGGMNIFKSVFICILGWVKQDSLLLYSGRSDDEHPVLGEGRRHGVRVDPRGNHVSAGRKTLFDFENISCGQQ